MLDRENEHEKALKTLASFPVSNLAVHVYCKFAFQGLDEGIYMFEFCPKKFTNTLCFQQCLSGCLTKNHAVRFTLKIRFALYLYHELLLF